MKQTVTSIQKQQHQQNSERFSETKFYLWLRWAYFFLAYPRALKLSFIIAILSEFLLVI